MEVTEFDSYIPHIRTFGIQWSEKVYFSNENQIANSVATFQRPSAVAVWKEDPFNIASVLSQFLKRDCNQWRLLAKKSTEGLDMAYAPTSSVVQGLTLKDWQR